MAAAPAEMLKFLFMTPPSLLLPAERASAYRSQGLPSMPTPEAAVYSALRPLVMPHKTRAAQFFDAPSGDEDLCPA